MNGWKITAIVFMSLFAVETVLFVGLSMFGMALITDEYECQTDVCLGYEAFLYDQNTKTCSCFLDNKISHSEVLG